MTANERDGGVQMIPMILVWADDGALTKKESPVEGEAFQKNNEE